MLDSGFHFNVHGSMLWTLLLSFVALSLRLRLDGAAALPARRARRAAARTPSSQRPCSSAAPRGSGELRRLGVRGDARGARRLRDVPRGALEAAVTTETPRRAARPLGAGRAAAPTRARPGPVRPRLRAAGRGRRGSSCTRGCSARSTTSTPSTRRSTTAPRSARRRIRARGRRRPRHGASPTSTGTCVLHQRRGRPARPGRQHRARRRSCSSPTSLSSSSASFASATSLVFDSNQIMVKHTATYVAAHPGRVTRAERLDLLMPATLGNARGRRRLRRRRPRARRCQLVDAPAAPRLGRRRARRGWTVAGSSVLVVAGVLLAVGSMEYALVTHDFALAYVRRTTRR